MRAKGMMARQILMALMLAALLTLAGSPGSVSADPAAAIEITVTASITGWELSPQGTRETTGTLTVTTTEADGKSWYVTATDKDTDNTSGKMTKYSSGAYVTGTKLTTAMQVQGDAGTVTLSGGDSVVTGSGNVTGAEYTITFKQTVLWTDAVVTDPDCYRIVVTFTGSISE